MACCNPIFGDLQENLQIINLTIPLHDYLRHKEILIHITRRNIRFKRLTELLSKAGNDDDIEFDEDFKMPREVLLRPETCIIRYRFLLYKCDPIPVPDSASHMLLQAMSCFKFFSFSLFE